MEERRTIRGFKDLVVWQRSVALAVKIYQITKNFPREEIYGLTSQIRRAAVSIPSNIAEGHGKGSRPSFASHIDIALGSAAELETQLEISIKIGYLSQSESDSLLIELTEIVRMLYGLLNKVQPDRHAH
ncbi:MAG: four helix bundle protein [Anaerolineales bacterium]|nr:four helix bundle protein [Anaerolineales bacterium]